MSISDKIQIAALVVTLIIAITGWIISAIIAINGNRNSEQITKLGWEKSEELLAKQFENNKEQILKASRPILYLEKDFLKFSIPSKSSISQVVVRTASMSNRPIFGIVKNIIEHEQKLEVSSVEAEEYIIVRYTSAEQENRIIIYLPIISIYYDFKLMKLGNNIHKYLEYNLNTNDSYKYFFSELYIKNLCLAVKNDIKTITLEHDIDNKELFGVYRNLRTGNEKEAVRCILEFFSLNVEKMTLKNIENLRLIFKDIEFDIPNNLNTNNLSHPSNEKELVFINKWKEKFKESERKINILNYLDDMVEVLSFDPKCNLLQYWIRIPISIINEIRNDFSSIYFHSDKISELAKKLIIENNIELTR